MRITVLGSSALFPMPRTKTNAFGDYLDIQMYRKKYALHNDSLCNAAKRGGKDRRTRAALAVQQGEKTILIDAGPDIRYQLKKFRIKPDAVFITHNHADADYGLRYLKNVPVYAEHLHTLRPGRDVRMGDIRIQAFRVHHSGDVPAVGFEVTAGGKRLLYASDIASLAGLRRRIVRADVFFADGSSLGQKVPTHLAMDTQLATYKRWKLRTKIIFTHVGHATLPHRQLVHYIREHYKRGAVAYDGMRITL